jgi:predicted ATPase/DNA-binding SARP family transcriptional activator
LLPLAGAQRALLALLLLSANQVVSSDRLIEELWGERSPESGRTALQVRVSQLRKALGDAGTLVVTRAPGYVLEVDAEQLDLARFERLVAEADDADPPAAAAKLREALALWRGPPLADLAYESFAQPAIARLAEVRLVVTEKRIDADLALGRHAEVAAELEALVAEHPLRERMRAQLMLALYRCGRQADALAVYQGARRELVEELGLEPSPPLRELEQSILRQDPSLDLAPRAPSMAVFPDGPEPSVERRYNLPAQVSSFVGRERELSDLQGLLSRTRTLTLVGAGGVGKTRLALELGGRALDGWRDGAWFVDLAPLADPALVAAKVASVLAVPVAAGRPASDAVVAALRSRELIVILDNCEHLIDSAATLAGQIVTACPMAAVVSTSREPLRIGGEQVYRVPSLSLPAADDENPECLPDSEAVRLFVDRARQQRPGFALDTHNCPSVSRLCRRLDGIPLAIELAAARVRAMPVDEIEKRLDRRFGLLVGGNRTALPRQQTLQALIDWSYDLLSASEQELLERLSVFAGGFDLEGAEAIADRGQDTSVFDEVVALVDKSLVEWDDIKDRYRLLESIREYAGAKLLARGPEAASAARTAHRNCYLRLAEIATPHLVGHDQLPWLDRLELEVDNLRLAITQCNSDPEPEPGLRFVRALRYFWIRREPRAEAAQSVCEALDRADAQARTLLRGQALAAAAHVLTKITADYDDAAVRAREALSIAEALRDERLRADALAGLLELAANRGDAETHQALSAAAFQTVEELADPHLKAQLVVVAAMSPHVPLSERVPAFEEALALVRQTGDQGLEARILGSLGYLALDAGEIDAARSYLEESTRLVRRVDDRAALSGCTCNFGFASYLDGADNDAQRAFDETLRMARRNADPLMVAYAQLGLALLTSRTGDAYGAATLHGAADAIHERLGTSLDPVESRLRVADISALREVLGDATFHRAYDAGRRAEETVETPPNRSTDGAGVMVSGVERHD